MSRETAHWLAERIASLHWDGLAASTKHVARRCLVDALGCAAAGRQEPGVRIADTWARATYAPGPSSVWFTDRRLAPVAAAFVNASATSILDLDDGHRAASGHPGAAIVPAVIAAGQARRASLEQMLLAIVAGYEAGVGCADLRTAAARATVATGRWSAIGVAAALAKLAGFDAERTRHALTIAESHASNLAAADFSGFQGGHVKEGIPWSVVTGFAAAELAGHGLRGYNRALSNPALYQAPADTAAAPWIERTYFKRYACCRWIHSAIDAAVALQDEAGRDRRIESVTIETFERAATLPNAVAPADVIAAQFSLPFAVALALVRGADALLPLTDDRLADREVQEMARRIRVQVDPELEALFPARVAARVTLAWRDGSAQRLVVSPLGDHDHPMTDEQLLAKALMLSSRAGAGRPVPAPAAPPLLPDDGLRAVLAGRATAADLWAMLSTDAGGTR